MSKSRAVLWLNRCGSFDWQALIGRLRLRGRDTAEIQHIDTIICGDNVQVLRTFPDNCIDLTVTSPPYDNLRKYNGYSWDFEAVAQELYRVTKPGGVVVWVVADATINGSETGTSFRQALYFRDVVGFKLWDTMIYHKENPLPRRVAPNRDKPAPASAGKVRGISDGASSPPSFPVR